MKKLLWVVLGLLLVVLITGGAWVYIVKFESEKPVIQIQPDKKYLGQKLTVIVEDPKSGVAEVKVEFLQQGKSVVVSSDAIPKGSLRVEKTFTLKPLPPGLKDGDATLKVSAKDHSWNRGNPVSLEKNIIVDTIPPQVSVLGFQHYVNQGGAGLVTYQTNKEVASGGVQVGDVFFPGYPAGKNLYQVYFAVPPDAKPDISTTVIVEDHGGNQAKSGFHIILKAKSFKKDKIQLSDAFFNGILPYFTGRDPNLKGTPLEMFLSVNRKQREADHAEVKKICRTTTPQRLWSDTFVRLQNAKPMASFAQDRTYVYNGQEVDRQVHLGVDLASLAQSPVPAANSGKIVFAGPLGIYGNTVMIDHGCGLFSMYSHLSRVDAEVNKDVKRGDSVGLTGATGMAGGDHL
ncbi:MAG TPA: M23 family metallopeptidase, partial [Thermodesulfobacteriota bacterium]|nr:M23 family metallopeptidase [Thermodesulfobacteriota bacterium]